MLRYSDNEHRQFVPLFNIAIHLQSNNILLSLKANETCYLKATKQKVFNEILYKWRQSQGYSVLPIIISGWPWSPPHTHIHKKVSSIFSPLTAMCNIDR